MPSIPGPFPVPATTFSDYINVVRDFGASSSGAFGNPGAGPDSAAAIEAALAAAGTNGGMVLFPQGVYSLSRAVSLPYTGAGFGGEGYFCLGQGAIIQGNFADFLFRRPRGQDNLQPKGFKGLSFFNMHPAGGLVNMEGSTSVLFDTCRAIMDGGGQGTGAQFACSIGFYQNGGNGPASAINCKVTGSQVTNSVGIGFASLGGNVIGCDVDFIDRAIMVANKAGLVAGNRCEVNNWAITLGYPPDLQLILSAVAGGAPGHTLLNVSTTICFQVGDAINPVNFNAQGSNISGTTVVSKTNTQLEVNTSSFTGVPFPTYITRSFSEAEGYLVAGNEGEGNVRAISLLGADATVVEANNFQGNFQPGFGASEAGLFYSDGCKATLVQANHFTGQFTSAPIYFSGGNNNPPQNSGQQFNNIGSADTEECMVTQQYTTGAQSFQLFTIPRWLDNAINVTSTPVFIHSNRVTIPGGTTVTGAHTDTNIMTISAGITGTLTIYSGFWFSTDSAGNNPIGQVSLV